MREELTPYWEAMNEDPPQAAGHLQLDGHARQVEEDRKEPDTVQERLQRMGNYPSVSYPLEMAFYLGVLSFRVYSPPSVDRIWLWVHYNKIPIYPIFYIQFQGLRSTVKTRQCFFKMGCTWVREDTSSGVTSQVLGPFFRN